MPETSEASPVVCSICGGREHVLANPNSRLKVYLKNNVPGYEDGTVCHTCYMKLKEPRSNPADDTLDRIVNQETPLVMKHIRGATQESIIQLSSSLDINTPSRESSLSAPVPSNRRVRETPERSLLREIYVKGADDLRMRGVTANDMPRNNGG